MTYIGCMYRQTHTHTLQRFLSKYIYQTQRWGIKAEGEKEQENKTRETFAQIHDVIVL